jgi:hypothetical protein
MVVLMPVTISVDTREVIRSFGELRDKDARFLLAYALTKTGQDIKDAEYASTRDVFDRPTRYTLNSLQLTPATKDKLTAVVDYRYFGGTPADRYLGPQVEGGARSHKSHEKALIAAGIMRPSEFTVPGAGVELDQYGNVKGGTFTRILSQLRASRDSTQNMTAKSRKRAISRAKGQYFVMRGRVSADGIYQRTDKGIIPILMFVRTPRYRQRYPFHTIGQGVFKDRFALRAREGYQKYVLSRLRRKA